MTASFHAYRIVKTKWADSAFDGEGARVYGGRWNRKGVGCVYLASSESLAMLEMLVHLNDSHLADAYTLFKVTIPNGGVLSLDVSALPANWQDDPAPMETASIGDEWLASLVSVGLRVPSTIVAREQNVLLNPRHPDYAAIIKTAQQLPFGFDPRLK